MRRPPARNPGPRALHPALQARTTPLADAGGTVCEIVRRVTHSFDERGHIRVRVGQEGKGHDEEEDLAVAHPESGRGEQTRVRLVVSERPPFTSRDKVAERSDGNRTRYE